MIKQEIRCGCRDGVPIALGYFSVSFSFGIMAMSGGLSGFQAALMSLTNMTSAGQFAGLQVIIAGGTLLEMAATQLIINLRYALMSLSLSQKLAGKVTMRQRFVIAFANTDEIFAVAMSHGKELSFPYIVGLQVLPILGWTAGTACGAAAAGLGEQCAERRAVRDVHGGGHTSGQESAAGASGGDPGGADELCDLLCSVL